MEAQKYLVFLVNTKVLVVIMHFSLIFRYINSLLHDFFFVKKEKKITLREKKSKFVNKFQ